MSKLKFEFEILPLPGEKIDVYDQGHITIQGKNGIITTKKNNGSVMIFLTIEDLLGCVIDLSGHEIIKKKIEGIDFPFSFYLYKKEDGKIHILDENNKEIDAVSLKQLVKILWSTVKEFVDEYRKDFDESDICTIGFNRDMDIFEDTFRRIGYVKSNKIII